MPSHGFWHFMSWPWPHSQQQGTHAGWVLLCSEHSQLSDLTWLYIVTSWWAKVFVILVSNMFILPCMSCPQKTMKGFVLNKLYCSSQSPGVFSKKGHNSLTHPGLSDLCILPLLLHVFRYIINIFIFKTNKMEMQFKLLWNPPHCILVSLPLFPEVTTMLNEASNMRRNWMFWPSNNILKWSSHPLWKCESVSKVSQIRP